MFDKPRIIGCASALLCSARARNTAREARALPEPQLPPFDEWKFEPMPDVELNRKDEFWVDPGKPDSP